MTRDPSRTLAEPPERLFQLAHARFGLQSFGLGFLTGGRLGSGFGRDIVVVADFVPGLSVEAGQTRAANQPWMLNNSEPKVQRIQPDQTLCIRRDALIAV